MTPKIQDGALRELQRTLGRQSIKASVTAANLANVDTPGYRARQATFDQTLESVRALRLETTDGRHVGGLPDSGGVQPRITDSPATRMRPDGNTVDVDREMTALARIQGRYAVAAQMLKRRFGLLRYVLTDGKVG